MLTANEYFLINTFFFFFLKKAVDSIVYFFSTLGDIFFSARLDKKNKTKKLGSVLKPGSVVPRFKK